VIKSRFVDEDTLYKIEHDEDFIAVLSTLVEYDKRYQNIVENQLGTTLVSSDISSATRLSKKIHHRYKIVTLTGDVVHIGGSMSGGSSYQASSMIRLKQQLARNLEQIDANKNELKVVERSLKEITEETSRIEKSYFDSSKEGELLKEKQERVEKELQELENKHEVISKEWDSYQSLNDHALSSLEEELITKFHEKQTEKELLTTSISSIQKNILELKMKLEEEDATLKLQNNHLREVEKARKVILMQMNKEMENFSLYKKERQEELKLEEKSMLAYKENVLQVLDSN